MSWMFKTKKIKVTLTILTIIDNIGKYWQYFCFFPNSVQEATQSYMTPSSVRDHIAALWENEKEVLSRIFVAMADAAGKHDEFDTGLVWFVEIQGIET